MTEARILIAGAWDERPEYPRARSVIAALRYAGFQVTEHRAQLPYSGHDKRALVSRPQRWPATALKLLRARRRFRSELAAQIANCRPDAVLVPYPGHSIVHWVRPLFDGPLLLDLFLSAYDTAVADRRMFRPRSLPARLLRRLDVRACAAADLVLLDTAAHALRVAELTGSERSRFSWLPVSDPDAPAAAPPYSPPQQGQQLEVLFFGTGVPLHGLRYLLGAMHHNSSARLTVIGGSDDDRRFAAGMPDERVRLLPPFVDRDRLEEEITRSHLIAGVFGDSAKAGCVVPLKVVHGLAFGRPVLTADTPAVRELLRPPRDCAVCPAADPQAIAAALASLAGNPAVLVALAEQARPTYDATFSVESIGRRLRTLLDARLPCRPPATLAEPAEAVS